jgi:hypothetical protein
MIKYKLICNECANTFDSWFSSSREYEKLKKQNYINCHICNSLNVEKTLMSPSVLKSQKNYKIEIKKDKYKKIKKTIDEYQKFITKNFEYVGENFAYKARSIHYKDKKKTKGIYGSASKEEIQELSEEGIEAEIIPWLKDKNN